MSTITTGTVKWFTLCLPFRRFSRSFSYCFSFSKFQFYQLDPALLRLKINIYLYRTYYVYNYYWHRQMV